MCYHATLVERWGWAETYIFMTSVSILLFGLLILSVCYCSCSSPRASFYNDCDQYVRFRSSASARGGGGKAGWRRGGCFGDLGLDLLRLLQVFNSQNGTCCLSVGSTAGVTVSLLSLSCRASRLSFGGSKNPRTYFDGASTITWVITECNDGRVVNFR